MGKKEEVWLFDISEKLKGTNVSVNNASLKLVLARASNSDKPHCSLDLIKKLEMKPTKVNLCNTIYGWVKYAHSVPLSKLIKIIELSGMDKQEIEKSILSINAGSGLIQPKFPIKIDKKLGSITGHILGDGSIDKRYKQVFFSNSEKELLREFSENMEDVFKVKPRIWMQKAPEFGNTKWDRRLQSVNELTEGRNGGLFYPTICGLMLNAIFDDFAIGKDKKITDRMINTPKEFKIGLVRAFYDDEGSVGRKNIRLFQDRKDILEVFRGLLAEFGITSGEIKTYFKRDKERYYFDIFRKSNFLKFQNEIGFTSPLKSERLRKLNIVTKPWNAK